MEIYKIVEIGSELTQLVEFGSTELIVEQVNYTDPTTIALIATAVLLAIFIGVPTAILGFFFCMFLYFFAFFTLAWLPFALGSGLAIFGIFVVVKMYLEG